MKFITVSELRAHATKIVSEVETSGEAAVVTKHGKPVVLIKPVSSEDFHLMTDSVEVQYGTDQRSV